MRKCSINSMDKVFAKIAESLALYLPVDGSDGKATYKKWENGVKWSNALNTTKSPKDLFFPQSEDLMAFKTRGKSIEIIDTRNEAEDFVVFGVRACDVKSLEILDRVFLSEPKDSYYASRREHGIIISLACNRPTENCFCGSFGIDASSPNGDVTCWLTEDALYLRANTEKGEALLASVASLLEDGCEKAVAEAQGLTYTDPTTLF